MTDNGRTGNPAQDYCSSYVKEALYGLTELKEPDCPRAGEYAEIVSSIWDAYKSGGKESVKAVWYTIKRLKPDLARFDELKLIHADELKGLSRPEYLIEDYPFFSGGFNVLVGPSGGGKSFVALDFSARLLMRGKTVIYIAGEGLHGYAARWEVLKVHLGITTKTNFHFYTEPVQVMDEGSRNEFISQIRQQKINPDIIIVDTLARCSVGMEENSNREMGVFVGALDIIRNEFQCGVLVVHHTGKDGHTRGASALIGACDSALMLTKADGRIKLSNQFDDGGKNKHDAEQKARFIELSPMTVGQWSSAVVRPAEAIVTSPVVTGTLTNAQRSILEALEAFGTPMTVKQIQDASKVSRSSIFRARKDLTDAGYINFDEKADTWEITESGRKAFYAL